MIALKKEELQPGQRYRILLHDCCVNGTLTGTFLRWEADKDGESAEDVAIFDIGTIGPRWGAWDCAAVEPEA